MKKLLTSFAVAAIISISANAQDSTSTVPTASSSTQKGQKWQAKYDKASPEKQNRMKEWKAVMEKLSPEQKAAVKQEMARHRQAMKQFGFPEDMFPHDSTGQQ